MSDPLTVEGGGAGIYHLSATSRGNSSTPTTQVVDMRSERALGQKQFSPWLTRIARPGEAGDNPGELFTNCSSGSSRKHAV